jgi:hypothetical protein
LFDFTKRKQQKVLVDLNLDWNDPLIGKVYKFFDRYRENFQVYLNVAGISTPPASMMPALSRRGLLANKPRLRLHDMDFVVPIGYESRGLIEEGLTGKHSWLRQLKKTGLLCMPLGRNELSPGTKDFKQLVGNSPIDVTDRLNERGPGVSLPCLNEDEVETSLRACFKDVQRVELNEGSVFIIASKVTMLVE